MLNICNQEDVAEMMKYHRTRDMINLITYFPELSPIRNLTLVQSIDDYYEHYEFCKNFSSQRNDNLLTSPCIKSLEVAESNPDVVKNIFPTVKKLDKNGVIVLFDLCCEVSQRYERYAGIGVSVSLGILHSNGVFLEAVGQGYDGREVSKGLDRHEGYFIPWYELRRVTCENLKDYRTYLVSSDEYQVSRNKRISFLTGLGIPSEIALEFVPAEYTEIPDFIWQDVLVHCVKKVEKMEDELISAHLTDFSISGHTEGKKYLPWQMFDKSRYTLMKRR